MKDLAPIVLFVYSRPDHTRRTLESLKKNHLASDSKLFIFSDGPKNQSAENSVIEVRNVIKNLDGFKSIEIIERDENLGLANSVISGLSQFLDNFEKAIVLEDDLKTSVNFLDFMNGALNFYEYDNRVMSISGYSFPIIFPENFSDTIYFSPRPSSWGWATWKEEWESAVWNFSNSKKLFENKSKIIKFNLGGEDLYWMLVKQLNDKLDSWGIRWAYNHFLQDKLAVYPKVSLVSNIGVDGSGTHHKKSSNKFDVVIDKGEFNYKFTDKIEINSEILREINKLVKPSIIKEITNRVKYSLQF